MTSRLLSAAALSLALFLLVYTPLSRALDERRILVLGDSISAAYGMSLEQGWVALLEEHLEAQDSGFSVVNASISGETSDGQDGRVGIPDLDGGM